MLEIPLKDKVATVKLYEIHPNRFVLSTKKQYESLQLHIKNWLIENENLSELQYESYVKSKSENKNVINQCSNRINKDGQENPKGFDFYNEQQYQAQNDQSLNGSKKKMSKDPKMNELTKNNNKSKVEGADIKKHIDSIKSFPNCESELDSKSPQRYTKKKKYKKKTYSYVVKSVKKQPEIKEIIENDKDDLESCDSPDFKIKKSFKLEYSNSKKKETASNSPEIEFNNKIVEVISDESNSEYNRSGNKSDKKLESGLKRSNQNKDWNSLDHSIRYRKHLQSISELSQPTKNEISSDKNVCPEKIAELKVSSLRQIGENKVSSLRQIGENKVSSLRQIVQLKDSSLRQVDELKVSSLRQVDELKVDSLSQVDELKVSSGRSVNVEAPCSKRQIEFPKSKFCLYRDHNEAKTSNILEDTVSLDSFSDSYNKETGSPEDMESDSSLRFIQKRKTLKRGSAIWDVSPSIQVRKTSSEILERKQDPLINERNRLSTETLIHKEKRNIPHDNILSIDQQGVLKRWNCKNDYLIRDYGKPHNGQICALAISPNREFFFTAGTDKNLKQWCLFNNILIHNWGKVHNFPIYSIEISKDSKFVYTSGKDSILKKLDIRNKEIIKDFGQIHEDWVISIKQTHDQKFFFTACYDNCIKQFCCETNEELKDYGEVHDYEITCLAITPNDKYLFSGSDDMSIKQWEIQNELVLYKTYKNAHEDCVKDLVIDKNGNYLFSASDDQSIRMWSIKDAALMKILQKTHSSWIRNLSISFDNEYLFSASYDKTICKWKMTDEKITNCIAFFYPQNDEITLQECI